MKRCWCEYWARHLRDYGPFYLTLVDKNFHQGCRIYGPSYCLWCGSQLAENKKLWAIRNAPAKSTAKRLNVQMDGPDYRDEIPNVKRRE